MPQANSIPFETANLDLISDRPRKVSEYRLPARERERTYSLPNRPENISFTRSNSQSDEDESDSDPLARMRVNLERTTFLLSRLKVGLNSKPEVIEIKPPASDSSDEYPHYHYLHKPRKRGPRPDYVVAPSTMERRDSTSTNSSTQFSLEVSNYNYLGPNDGHDDHGSEFHQLALSSPAEKDHLAPYGYGPLPHVIVTGHEGATACGRPAWLAKITEEAESWDAVFAVGVASSLPLPYAYEDDEHVGGVASVPPSRSRRLARTWARAWTLGVRISRDGPFLVVE
ncbi:hypothetical protein EST38_g9489 [Candolleomyces aberdarensis]|uniref:Uncharacterized protein n=1 Tax=Candolleomyces aberdarensis TaxID=2316362 RepID=A0A4Q2DD20_9AGAR|nr:hypothetical protein EST38_g9489 [Candolleomyces aberdarensis]